MMTRANADAVAIEDRRQIVGMNVAVREWNDAGPMVAWSVDGHALDLGEPLNGDPGKRGLVLGNAVHPQLLQVSDRSTEADRRFDVRRPTLELVRDLVPGRVVVPDPLDHFATAMVGGIASSSAGFAIKAPLPIGASILWPENAKKSQSIACTSTRRCGAACAPSTTATAPAACANLMSCATGFTVPSEFET